MTTPKFTCPICGYSETPWNKEDHANRHDFLKVRVGYENDKELFGGFVKEHPNIKKEKSDGSNVK